MKHRGKSRPPRKIEVVSTYQATRPRELFSWDITYLPTLVLGIYYYLYLFMDIFSRKIVGHEVHETESMEKSSNLIENICIVENIQRNQIITHADNGNPQEGLYHACNLATTWNCTFVQQTWGQ